MRTATNKRRITFYVAFAFSFIAAGVLQAVDARLPEFWHALFALIAHTILITLVAAWGVSIFFRTVRKDLRAFFLTVAVLILFFLVVRMIKYGLTKDTDTLSRYLWYAYYVPQTLIPPTLFLSAMSLENKKGKPLEKIWYLAYLPAVILLALIFTNDIHRLAFNLSFDGGFSYSHGTVFYIALAWEIVVTFLSMTVLTLKCSVSACKKRIWIPLTVFTVCVIASTVCFLTDVSAFKIPELLCFTCIAMIESCIAIGLIPTNENYENYFYRSACSAVITDENFNVVYRSDESPAVDKSQLERAAKSPVMTDENTRLSAERIHGGYAFRSEDLSLINEINAVLSETNERLSEENDIIEAENELKEQRARIEEQNRLFAKTEEYTREELKRLGAFLSETKTDEDFNSDEFVKRMRIACASAAYVKRRSNLVILAEKNEFIDAGELSLAIGESLDYLSFTGAEISFDCGVTGKIKGEDAGVIYDFFEECVVRYDDMPTALMVRLNKSGDDTVLFIESDTGAENAADISERIKNKFNGRKLR